VSTQQREQTFPRKRLFTTILNIRYKLLIYNDQQWDDWPSKSHSKWLYSILIFRVSCFDAPADAPSNMWLDYRERRTFKRERVASNVARGTVHSFSEWRALQSIVRN
jgi:hypothetical protein